MKISRKASPDRTRPPKAGPSGKVSFPKYFEKKLKNGFKIFVVENHQLPIVTVGFVVKSGAVHDGALPGLSSVTCELLTKGTRKRSATQIAEEIDFIGGSLSHTSSWDASQLFVSVLKNHFAPGFDILSDVVLNPTFPTKEISRVKAQRSASIQQMKADPGYLADTRFSAVVFGDHPYGNTVTGTEKSIAEIRREDILTFHKSFYTPDNSFIVFAGDITPSEAEKFTTKYFGKWKGKHKVVNLPIPEHNAADGRVFIADKPGAVQSSLRLGHIGVARNNPDFVKLSVMNTILGGYFSSRINMNLREVHGYTYGSRTGFDARSLPGTFEVSADVRNEVTAETIDEILKELNRIRDSVPSKDEMTMVKNYLTGLFPIQLETAQQVAGRVVAIELYGLPQNYYRNYRENIRKVTARDVRSVATRYIHPEKVSIVLSGAAKEIAGKLGKFGRIDVTSPDGKPAVKEKKRKP
jgi:zinc protease